MTEAQAAEMLVLLAQVVDLLEVVKFLVYTGAGSLCIGVGMFAFRLVVLAKNERDFL